MDTVCILDSRSSNANYSLVEYESVRARSCINPNPKYINTYGLYSMNTTSRTSTTISTSS